MRIFPQASSEQLRLYDIFREVFLQSYQHEYIHVHCSGRSGSGSDNCNGMPMLGGLEVKNLKQTVTLLQWLLQHRKLYLSSNSLIYNTKPQIKVIRTSILFNYTIRILFMSGSCRVLFLRHFRYYYCIATFYVIVFKSWFYIVFILGRGQQYEAVPTCHLEMYCCHSWHPEQPILQLHYDHNFDIDDIGLNPHSHF
jgi:hypothetical protein